MFLAQWEKVCFWVWGSSHAENFFLKMCRNWYYGKTCFIFSNVFLAQWEFVIGFSGLRWGVRFLLRSFFIFVCVEVWGSRPAEVIFLFLCFRRSRVRFPLRSFFLFFIFSRVRVRFPPRSFFLFFIFRGRGFDSR